MTWYWDVLIGVGVFNVLFVLGAWLTSMLRHRNGTAFADREETYLSHECILHFLQTMCLAEQQKSN